MITRIETIELHSSSYYELMDEFNRDAEEKRKAGWRVQDLMSTVDVDGFTLKYAAERRIYLKE